MLPSLNVFLDDVEQILEILKESCKDAHISDRDFEFESLEELIDNKGLRPKSLNLQGHQPYLSLSFNRRDFPTCIHLFSTGESDEEKSLYLKVQNILMNRKKWTNYLFLIVRIRTNLIKSR